MIAGHFGFAAIVKSRVPRAPLWSLMLATVWIDVLFVPLLLLGVETIVPVAGGSGRGYGEGIIYADYTHSLLGALVLSAAFGALIAWRWGRVPGLAGGAVAFSHWLLDLPMHRHDLPLLPGNLGNLPRLGLGLWRWPTASALLELALVLAGTFLYWRAALAAVHNAQGRGNDLVRRAHVASAAMLVSGLVTLALSVAGV